MQQPALLGDGASNTAPVKEALCIQRAHAPDEIQHATVCAAARLDWEFFKTPTAPIDRAVCETDESTLQLIPYLVLLNESTGAIFCYSRGKAGGEARLHSRLSIGLGGHVDVAPPKQSAIFAASSLYSLLDAEAKRELREEASLDYRGMLHFSALLNDPCDAVGRVHLGLLSVVPVTDAMVASMRTEIGVVERGEWLTPAQLREESVFERLEPWSKAALATLGAPT